MGCGPLPGKRTGRRSGASGTARNVCVLSSPRLSAGRGTISTIWPPMPCKHWNAIRPIATGVPGLCTTCIREVPSDYALKTKPQLMNIYVQLPFVRGNSQDTITVEQWGVANVQLRNAYLDQWFQDKNRALEGQLRYEARETVGAGTSGFGVDRAGGQDVSYWMSHALPQITRLQMPATHFEARIWECPDSNKIHLVQSFSRRPQPDKSWMRSSSVPCVTARISGTR